MSSISNKNALVIGGGVAGIQAALDLANMDFKVYLVEKEPSIGGHMAQLDKTFPTLDCSACILTPKMVDVTRHPNIQLITYARVEEVSGTVGDFKVKVKKKARFVDVEKCTGCGECVKECPVEEKDEFNLGLNLRKAIYRTFPQAIPNAFVIDKRGTPNCRVTCPAGINVQGYIALISQGKFQEALTLIRNHVPFPSVLGRVCYRPCEMECARGELDEPIAICALKRAAADYGYHRNENEDILPQTREEKVAIVGSGPAGLTTGFELVKKGYPVTIYESLPEPGGMLRVGIPEYRLPKNILDAEIEYIKQSGLIIRTGIEIGKDLTIDDLFREGYKVIFIATGAHESRKLGIKGEKLHGVIHALHFLKEANLKKAVSVGKRVAVIGGGNVAIDAARVAVRSGSKKVNILYRRSREEMPAYPLEVEEAEKEGVAIHFLVTPKRIIGKNGRLKGIECFKMQLGDPDVSGRRRPIPIDGSEFVIEVDTVIIAIGQSSNLSLVPQSIETTKWNTITVDPITMETSMPGLFAGGDVVSGPASVIEAIAAGRRAAVSIVRYLNGEDIKEGREEEVIAVESVRTEGVEKRTRQLMPFLPIPKRIGNFSEVELGFTKEMAIEEAKRCLACGGCSECLECEKLCEAEAIIHQQKDEYIELDVGAIVVATGFEVFDARKKGEYGYGRYNNVITGMEFERLINAGGPTGGHLKRPSDDKTPKRIAFIQCVGSRDEKVGNLNCSRVCCMYAIKQAILIKEHYPEVDVTIFYMDLRAYGKGFEEFYKRAEDEFKIKFIRGAVSEVIEVPETRNLILRAEDMDVGEFLEKEFDLIILSVALTPPQDSNVMEKVLGVPSEEDGFFTSIHPEILSVFTPVKGIFIAGTAEGPKDIPDSVAQASAAAMKASIILQGRTPNE